MKDGVLKLEFEEGEIKGVFINANLRDVYDRMFRNARRCIKNDPEIVANGIKVIIFGSFMLEALSNEYVKDILYEKYKEKDLGKVLWDKLKRSSVLDKLIIISAFTNETLLKQYNIIYPLVKNIFDLRNRLAHFKDEDTKIIGEINSNHLESSLTNVNKNIDLNNALKIILGKEIPDPELVQELKGRKIIEHADVILDTKRWMNAVMRIFYRSIGIKRSTVSIE